MATEILGPNGLPLRATRPAAVTQNANGWFIQSIQGNASSNSWNDRDDYEYGYLKSYEDIYRAQPTVFTVVNKLARRIASIPLHAYRQESPNRRRHLPDDDPLHRIVHHPWPRASGLDLLTHVGQGLLIHGNALVVKVRGNGPDSPPTGLFPLRWTALSAWTTDGGPILGWSTTQFGGEERWIRPEDVVHFAWVAPDGVEIGVSPLEPLNTTIRLEDAAQRYQTAQFRNGNRPSMHVTVRTDKPVSMEVLNFVKDRVEQMHKGVDEAGKTFFTGANTEVKPISLTPVEAALIEQRKLDREEVGMVYDLAGPLMNDLTHGTYSNVEELQKGLYRDVIPPWTTLIVETLRNHLIEPEPEWADLTVAFDFGEKLRGDPTALSAAIRSDVDGGLRTYNEGRMVLGLEPWGDPDDPENPANQLFVNANNRAPLGSVAPAVPAVATADATPAVPVEPGPAAPAASPAALPAGEPA